MGQVQNLAEEFLFFSRWIAKWGEQVSTSLRLRSYYMSEFKSQNTENLRFRWKQVRTSVVDIISFLTLIFRTQEGPWCSETAWHPSTGAATYEKTRC